jgi:hypothetical protein
MSCNCTDIINQISEIHFLVQENFVHNTLIMWLEKIGIPFGAAFLSYLVAFGGKKLVFFVLAEIRIIIRKIIGAINGKHVMTKGEVEIMCKKVNDTNKTDNPNLVIV